MLFFTDALEGQIPQELDVLSERTDPPLTPAENLRIAQKPIFDRNIRTGLAAGSDITVSWDTAVPYDAVVLILQNATGWTITPTGVSGVPANEVSMTGTLTASTLQYVYANFASRVVDVSTGSDVFVRYDSQLTAQEKMAFYVVDVMSGSDVFVRHGSKLTDVEHKATFNHDSDISTPEVTRYFVRRRYFVRDLEVSGSQIVVSVTGTGAKIREMYVLKKYLDMSGNSDRPLRLVQSSMDPGRRAFRSENDTLISYSGLTPGGKSRIIVGWDFLGKEKLEMLGNLWLGPPIRKPFFVYSQPEDRPNEVLRVYWDNDFMPMPSAASLRSGYTIDLDLLEI